MCYFPKDLHVEEKAPQTHDKKTLQVSHSLTTAHWRPYMLTHKFSSASHLSVQPQEVSQRWFVRWPKQPMSPQNGLHEVCVLETLGNCKDHEWLTKTGNNNVLAHRFASWHLVGIRSMIPWESMLFNWTTELWQSCIFLDVSKYNHYIIKSTNKGCNCNILSCASLHAVHDVLMISWPLRSMHGKRTHNTIERDEKRDKEPNHIINMFDDLCV